MSLSTLLLTIVILTPMRSNLQTGHVLACWPMNQLWKVESLNDYPTSHYQKHRKIKSTAIKVQTERGHELMKKILYLFSPLIFLVAQIAFGQENNDTSGQTTTTAQKGRLNNSVDWATYRGDQEGTGYSSLSQITTENVRLLEEVWTYDTRNLVRPGMSSNPIVIEGVMYFADSELNLVALDAATGEELWLFDLSEHHSRGDYLASGIMRGAVYWEDENGNNSRIFHLTKDLVWAINPDDGTLIESFGSGGYIDLKENHVWPAHLLENKITNTSPPVIYDDHLILDSNVSEGREDPPGNIRSFNVLTGEFEWRFHTIPLEGQPGYETWEWEDNVIYGGANSWGGFTVDEERGWVFAATGSATGGIHGGGGVRGPWQEPLLEFRFGH